MQEAVYYSFKNYMKKIYKESLYTIPIDLDLGCPNRETDGTGGCTFCPENGARSAQTLNANTIEEQINKAIGFAKHRYNANSFMLYIQAYTGTFTSVLKQKETYSKLLKLKPFKAISIGTRPDCLNTSTLEYLSQLNKQLDVYIDLGIQSLNDDSLKRINRGHDSFSSIEAIKKLKTYGIKIFAHIIVGLEKESRKDWVNTVTTLCALKVDGIKIHNLHIIKNTKLYEEYKKNPFRVLNEYEYANELIYLIRHIPSNIPIIRISTDTPNEDLIEPQWKMQKGQFSEYVQEKMLFEDYRQGDLVEAISIKTKKYNTFSLEDGTKTIWDKKYKDYYNPKSGARRQAIEMFIKESKLEERIQEKKINLLDIGFGLGYNSLEAIKLKKINKLYITALDKNRAILKNSIGLQKQKKDIDILENLYKNFYYEDEANEINIIFDEARYSLQNIKKQYDIIFLDPFLHTVNPSLISVDFISLLKKVLKEKGIIISSCHNDSFKSALSLNGFKYEACEIEKTDIKGLKITLGKSFNNGQIFEDPYLIYREKQLIANKEKVYVTL